MYELFGSSGSEVQSSAMGSFGRNVELNDFRTMQAVEIFCDEEKWGNIANERKNSVKQRMVKGTRMMSEAEGCEFYSKNLKVKALNVWRVFVDILIERKKALECAIQIRDRSKQSIGFNRWKLFTNGIIEVSKEYRCMKSVIKVLDTWKNFVRIKQFTRRKAEFAQGYYHRRLKLISLINWTEIVRDSYRLKASKIRNISSPRKLRSESINIKEKNAEVKIHIQSLNSSNAFNCSHPSPTYKISDSSMKQYQLVKLSKSLKKKSAQNKRKKIFLYWRSLYHYRSFVKTIKNVLTYHLVSFGFTSLKQPRLYSLSNLSDYELRVTIKALETRMNFLHNQLLLHHLNHLSLLSTKQRINN